MLLHCCVVSLAFEASEGQSRLQSRATIQAVELKRTTHEWIAPATTGQVEREAEATQRNEEGTVASEKKKTQRKCASLFFHAGTDH